LNRFYPMSALPPKADIDGSYRDVRFVPQADIPSVLTTTHANHCTNLAIAR
jgi:hypothetical protein